MLHIHVIEINKIMAKQLLRVNVLIEGVAMAWKFHGNTRAKFFIL